MPSSPFVPARVGDPHERSPGRHPAVETRACGVPQGVRQRAGRPVATERDRAVGSDRAEFHAVRPDERGHRAGHRLGGVAAFDQGDPKLGDAPLAPLGLRLHPSARRFESVSATAAIPSRASSGTHAAPTVRPAANKSTAPCS